MTRLDQLYDRLLDEVPQLKVYLHRDAKGRIIAGPRWRYFEAPALIISERSGLDLNLWYVETTDGRPTWRHPNATYDALAVKWKGLHTQDQDRIVNLTEAYVARVIKLIDWMEQSI